jgi:hypothetical protein
MADTEVPPIDDAHFARLIRDGFGNDKCLRLVDETLVYDTRRNVPHAAVGLLPPSFRHFVVRLPATGSNHRILSIDYDGQHCDSLSRLSPAQRACIHALSTAVLPIAVLHSDCHFQFNTMVCLFLQEHLSNGTGRHATSLLAKFLAPHCRFTVLLNVGGAKGIELIGQAIPNLLKINQITHDAYWHSGFPFPYRFSVPPTFLPPGMSHCQDLRREYYAAIRELVCVLVDQVNQTELRSFRDFLASSFPVHAATLLTAPPTDLLATVAYRLSADHALDHGFIRDNWSYMRAYTSLTPSVLEWESHLSFTQAVRACTPAVNGSDLLKNVDYQFVASVELRQANRLFRDRISRCRYSELVTSCIAY